MLGSWKLEFSKTLTVLPLKTQEGGLSFSKDMPLHSKILVSLSKANLY